MIDLSKADSTGDFNWFPIVPHGSINLHPSVQGDAVGKVDEVEQLHGTVGLPDHLLLVILEISVVSAEGKGELGAFISGRGRRGRWGSDGVEELGLIGDLDLELGIGSVLHSTDLCKESRSIYAITERHPKLGKMNVPLPEGSQAWNQERVKPG